MTEERKGMLIVISGPSGTGKGTICERLLADDPSLTFSVSATTRAPRETEIEGVHYFFLTEEKYDRLLAQDAPPFLMTLRYRGEQLVFASLDGEQLVPSGKEDQR